MKERPWAQMWNISWNLCDLPTCTSLFTCSAAPAVTEHKIFGFFASATKGNSIHWIVSTPPLHLSLPPLIDRLCNPLWEHFSNLLNRWFKKCYVIHHLVSLLGMGKGGSNINFLIITVKAKWISTHFQQDLDQAKSQYPAGELTVKWSLLWLLLWSDLLSCEIILIHQY